MNELDPTTIRHTTHGDFANNAQITMEVVDAMARSPNWNKLACVQRLALSMMALKISRILSGNADEEEHWLDLAGYATLGRRWIMERRIRIMPAGESNND